MLHRLSRAGVSVVCFAVLAVSGMCSSLRRFNLIQASLQMKHQLFKVVAEETAIREASSFERDMLMLPS